MVDRQLIARLDAARVSFCLVGNCALAVHGCAGRDGDVELLAVDDAVLRPLFWEGGPAPTVVLGGPHEPVVTRLHWDGTPAHDLIAGRGHAMVFAVDTARLHEEAGCRVATPLGLVLLALEFGGARSRADIVDLVRAQEARFDRPWRPRVPYHLERLAPAARTSWHQVELDLGAVA
jgi:hypothetical protein